MTCMTNESRLSLPGAYCHGNDMSATASSLADTYQQGGVVDPATHHNDNKLAIISPIFFSPSLSPGSLRTSLPGTWVDTSPYQLQKDNKENDYTHNTSNTTLQQLQQQQYPYHRHQYQQQQQQQQQEQQKGASTSIAHTSSSTTTITETPVTPSSSSAVLDHVDMNQLRQTIASLRERAEQLEQTDLVVKKSIEIVAKKRLVWERRQYAQWDWCDHPGGNTSGGGGGNNEKAQQLDHTPTGGGSNNVPLLDSMNETDRSDDDDDDNDDYDGCGGDWEWID